MKVTLNETLVEALIDTGCRRTLVKKANGPFTPEILCMQCIHGDIWEYRAQMVTIGIETQTFTCRVGIVPRLDCGMLIGWDYPALVPLLRVAP